MNKHTQIYVSYAEEGRSWAEWIAAQWPEGTYEFVLRQRNLTDHLGSLKDIRYALDHFNRVIIIASPIYVDSIALREWPEVAGADSLAVIEIFATDEMMTTKPSLNMNAAELSAEVLSARLREWLRDIDSSTDCLSQLIRTKPKGFPRIWRVPFACPAVAANESPLAAHLRAALDNHQRVVLPAVTDGSSLDLAIRYAYEYRGQYRVVVFVNCDNEIQICNDLSALTGALGLSRARYYDQPFLIEKVKSWFEVNDSWLLIFHHVPDHFDLHQYEPATHTGHSIIVPYGLNAAVEIGRREPSLFETEKLPDPGIDKGLISEILYLMSWLGPEILPYYVWATDTEFSQKSGALSSLAQAGYIELTREGTRLIPALQPLLQARQSVSERQHHIGQALSLLIRNLPGGAQDYRKWPKYVALATHVLYTTAQARTYHAGSDSCVRLLNQLAIYQFKRFHWERAVALLRTALAIAIDVYGPEHGLVSLCYNNLGAALNELGNHSEALDCFSKALALDTMLYGSNSSRIATRLTNISQTLFKMGRPEEAIHFGQRAIEGAEAGQSAQTTRAPSRFLNLSQLLAASGDLKEATSLAHRALEAATTIYGPEHPQAAYYSTKLAELLELQDRLPEAERLLATALTINSDYYGNEHWKYHASAAALSRIQATLQSKQYQPVAENYGLERSTEDENHRTL